MANEDARAREARLARRSLRSLAAPVAGVLAGVATVVLAGTAVANRLTASTPERWIEATHVPPLLTAPNEPIELRYDVYCDLPDSTETDTPCGVAGTVFVRPGGTGPFREITLQEDLDAAEGRLVARLPGGIVSSRAGFSYYAVFRTITSGATVTLPAGGAAAPQRSLPLERTVAVRLGTHSFGSTQRASSRVAEAAWGTGSGEVGLEQGRNLQPMGGSSFDVDGDGAVYVLDEANRRLLRWTNGAPTPVSVPLAINGTLADMAVGEDGTIYVLEMTKGEGRAPLLRFFDTNGVATGASEVAERASQLRMGPDGPVLLEHPSGQWMTAAIAGRPLTPSAQRSSGRAGRPLPGGAEVVVLRRGDEIRVALTGRNGVRRTWQVTSETPLAEVQLAEPLGNRVLVVVRVYTDEQDEFLALVLGQNGVERRFSLDSSDWAETAPLSRFRLVGSSLFQLGSTPAGVFVDRFDMDAR